MIPYGDFYLIKLEDREYVRYIVTSNINGFDNNIILIKNKKCEFCKNELKIIKKFLFNELLKANIIKNTEADLFYKKEIKI